MHYFLVWKIQRVTQYPPAPPRTAGSADSALLHHCCGVSKQQVPRHVTPRASTGFDLLWAAGTLRGLRLLACVLKRDCPCQHHAITWSLSRNLRRQKYSKVKIGIFRGKYGKRVGRYWPERTRSYFWWFTPLCQIWWKSTKKSDRESDTRTDAHTDGQTDRRKPILLSVPCYMLWLWDR